VAFDDAGAMILLSTFVCRLCVKESPNATAWGHIDAAYAMAMQEWKTVYDQADPLRETALAAQRPALPPLLLSGEFTRVADVDRVAVCLRSADAGELFRGHTNVHSVAARALSYTEPCFMNKRHVKWMKRRALAAALWTDDETSLAYLENRLHSKALAVDEALKTVLKGCSNWVAVFVGALLYTVADHGELNTALDAQRRLQVAVQVATQCESSSH
jgi:hypothetical protein